MGNLKEVRIRIKSVETTRQITKAMKLVSASKLKRAQDRIVKIRPYSDKLFGMMNNIMANTDSSDLNLNFNEVREVQNVAVVVVSADKGLCGSFSSNILKRAHQLVYDKYKNLTSSNNLTVYCIGKKGFDYFRRRNANVNADLANAFADVSFEEISSLTEKLMNQFLNKEIDAVEVVYAEFKNAATQVFHTEQFLPIKPLEESTGSDEVSDFIYEPDKKQLLNELIPKILKTEFYRFVLDTNASEHGARMVAMDKASENANELLGQLKLVYNRERQAAITKELLEIVAGAAAMDAG